MEVVEGVIEIGCITVPLFIVGYGNNLFGEMKQDRDQAIKDKQEAVQKAAELNAAAKLAAGGSAATKEPKKAK